MRLSGSASGYCDTNADIRLCMFELGRQIFSGRLFIYCSFLLGCCGEVQKNTVGDELKCECVFFHRVEKRDAFVSEYQLKRVKF